jgi:hypothetical protein
MSQTFWADKPRVLVDNPLQFFPVKNMSQDERLNSIVRMFFYYAVLMFFFTSDLRYFLILACIMIVTVVVHNNEESQSSTPNETFDNRTQERCTGPTMENPFMNMLYGDPPDKPPACDISDEAVAKKVDTIFNNRLYRDADEMYSEFVDKQFYSVPVTSKYDSPAHFWALSCPKKYTTSVNVFGQNRMS